jgi:hypothetical protein
LNHSNILGLFVLDISNCISTVIINYVGLRLLSSFSTLEKEERLFELGIQEYSPDLTIRLTAKEYNQYVKKAVKILHKDEKEMEDEEYVIWVFVLGEY